MFGLGMPELVVVMVLALLVFGPKSLPGIGSGLAKAIRGFREGTEESGSTSRMEAASGALVCPDCGAAAAAATTFCTQCGKKRSQA